jgi:hypothetical protein
MKRQNNLLNCRFRPVSIVSSQRETLSGSRPKDRSKRLAGNALLFTKRISSSHMLLLGSITPHILQFIKTAIFRQHHMDNYIHIID